MIETRDNVCPVCRTCISLKSIKSYLAETQDKLSTQWNYAAIIQLDNDVFPSETRSVDWFVMNSVGKPTSIPSYAISQTVWKRAYFVNPLEVDWTRFEIHDTADMNYLVGAVEVLQDTVGLWSTDIDTQGNEVFELFSKFVSALKRLLIFSLNVSMVDQAI